ncbi:MAG: bifunctional phosphopantothenoylcysteine decarboxylase/phosphopantothenate--cysteine ligase CoaBC [Flavisolibacter sp.]
MLAGKKIILGITGSIAAYKIPLLVRQLTGKGAEVKVIMTPAATDFVSRLTLSTLSRNSVLVDLFAEGTWANHVALGRWADVMVIAPLSCNTLSKMAIGSCENLLLATYLSATCPVIVAPAMDEDMWHHPSTRTNLGILKEHGCSVLPVGYGELASGLTGEGRMAEPEEMVSFLEEYFTPLVLKGKKALVTAGPTYEAIDPVRFIGNHSTGKMGYALAEELQKKGAEVILVSGPVSLPEPPPGVRIVRVTSAEEMYQACMAFPDYDIAVMAAAVADYAPTVVADQKIKKDQGELVLSLKRTRDILGSLGKSKSGGQVLVGFALETHNEEANALKKLKDKNADIIVMNSLKDEAAGFGYDTNKVTLYFRDGSHKAIELKSKKALARDIVESITRLVE